jgi:hypothetical protein
MSRKLSCLILGLLTSLAAVGCGLIGGDKCDDFEKMCRSCTTSQERSLCEDLLAEFRRNPTPAGVSRSDLCETGMDAFIGTSCRR